MMPENKKTITSVTGKKPNRVIIRGCIVVMISLALFIFMLFCLQNFLYSSKVRTTSVMLKMAKFEIEEFKKNTGKYPSSLKDLWEYQSKHNTNPNYRTDPYKEYISCPTGSSKEYTILDNKGGWYYNNANGEVKVNLTKPLKEYIGYYFGKERNEIPAEW